MNETGQALGIPTNSADTVVKIAEDLIEATKKEFNKFKDSNPNIEPNNVKIYLKFINKLMKSVNLINDLSADNRETYYYVIYNSLIIIHEISRMLRKGNYHKEAAQYFAFIVLSCNTNIILTSPKYLLWRVKNYVELARSYSDWRAPKATCKTIAHALEQVKLLKSVQEQDPPVIDSTQQAISEAMRILNTLDLKYQLQTGVLTPENWRKKVEETFSKDKYHRALCIVESLTTEEPGRSIPIEQSLEKAPWKKDALTHAIALINPDIEKVKEALIQIHEKKKKAKEQEETMKSSEGGFDVDEMLATHKKMNNEMIKEKDWKQASYNAPLEIHVQLIIFAYETKNRDQFEALLKTALIRLKFRRYEVPYVSTIDILMSMSKDANIPNSFEKLPLDLNAANLRIELAKLKQIGKKKADQAEEAKQVKEPPKAKDAKGGKDKDKASKEKAEPELAEDEGIIATEEELEAIKHIFVNLLIQRSKNPKNAIVGINVIMIDESNDYEIPENHYAVAVPIKQHEGVYEASKTIPYIIFKRTPNFLRDEDDLLSLITDVKVIAGKNPNVLPPVGYHKIPVDLRQTPASLENSPKIDCVFVCYKTDKDINVYERDLLTLKKLSDLNQSIIQISDPKYEELPEVSKNLGLVYDIEFLLDISKNTKDSLLGPVGSYYARQRNDQLNHLSTLLLKNFIFPIRKKMEQYFELRSQNELVKTDRINFKEVLLRIHQILAKNTQSKKELALIYLIASIYLANLCEEDGDFRQGIQIMRSALSRVIEAREHRMKYHTEYANNPNASMAMHLHGFKIQDTEKSKNERYKIWESLILRKERERVRQESGLPLLDEDEADEEATEVERLEKEKHAFMLFMDKIKQDHPEGEQEDVGMRQAKYEQKKLYQYYLDIDDLINDLHIDILACLYRCEIKLGSDFKDFNLKTTKMLKIKGIKAPDENTAGLSTSLKKKYTMKNTKSIAKATTDFKGLQNALQEAGKIPVSRPSATNFEKLIMMENDHNVYQNALFSMQVATTKSNIVEQKSLLLESYEYLKKSGEDEEKLKKIVIDNSASIKIVDHLMNNDDRGEGKFQTPPFNVMDKVRYLRKTVVPPKPIMVSRTWSTITMKVPYFRPQTDHKEWRNIHKMALFGKESGSGVAVSLNNTEFPGTGNKVDPGTVITVSGLVPNKKYVFACGGYTEDGTWVNGIGETSEEILTALPLNINILYGYLAQISYKLKQYQISKKAAETLLTQFIDKNETRYRLLDGEKNPALLFKLKYDFINQISITTIRQIVECFLILANISKIKNQSFNKGPIGADSPQVKKTKLQLRIWNFLLLALELSILLRNSILIKRVVAALFNHSLPFLSFSPRPAFLSNYLLYFHQAILLIPSDLMDGCIRRIGSCLSYEISKNKVYHLVEGDNQSLYHKILMTELVVDLRKWQLHTQTVTKLDQLTEEQKTKQAEQKAAIANGTEISEEDIIRDPEPYDVDETMCSEFEKEGKAYEEFLMMFKVDYAEKRATKWKAKLNKLIPKITNGEEVVEDINHEIDEHITFWKGIKENPEAQINNQALKDNPKFLEFTCKAFQRVMELGNKNEDELDSLIEAIHLNDESISPLEESINNTKENLSHDTVLRRQNRFNLIEAKVKEIQDSTQDIHISMVDLDKLLNDIKRELAETEQFQKLEFTESQTKYYLQVSQFLFVKSMVTSMVNRKAFEYEKDTGLPSYQNVVLLDFLDLLSQVNDFKESIISKKHMIREDLIEKKQKFTENQPAEGEGDSKIPEIDEIEVPVKARTNAITRNINLLSRAAQYSQISKSWVLLENIVKYTWNLITYELVSPMELSQTDAYKDISILTECILDLLSHVKISNNVSEEKPATTIIEARDSKTVKFADETTMVKKPQKNVKASDSDVRFYSSFITYTIQCLFVAEKWESMVDLADIAWKQLNTLYPDPDDDILFLLAYLLQFRIYAENKLFSAANAQTEQTKNELETRIQKFNHWKATSKKSKSRQAMLTGEKPKEELDFLRDKEILQKEVFRLEVHETFLRIDKEQSEMELDRIKKASSNTKESLRQSRKLYKKFGLETKSLDKEIEIHGYNKNMAPRIKSHAILTNMVISSYHKSIELIRKRQEKFLLLQGLHEIGNLYYSDNQLKHAETSWNDAVDTIFQKDVGMIKVFRPLFKEVQNIAATYGPMQCLIGGWVLAKLGKLCYNTNLHLQRECIVMGSEMFAAPFKISLFHPHEKIEFIEYRMKEFLPEVTLLMDKQVLQPMDLLNGLEMMSEMLIDYEMYERVLPLATLMNYVATDLVKTVPYMIKARVLKGIALCHLGYISQALHNFYQIIQNKDKIVNVFHQSEYFRQRDGSSFKFSDNKLKYRNDLPPEEDINMESINHLISVIPELTETKMISPLLNNEIKYLKNLILLTLWKDPFDTTEVSDLRRKYFALAEEGFKDIIKSVEKEEEVSKFKYKLNIVSNMSSQDSRIPKYQSFLERKYKKLAGLVESEVENQSTIYDYNDEEKPHSLRRSERLSWIVRCKNRLSQLYKSSGSLIQAYYTSRATLYQIAQMNMPIGITNEVPKTFDDKRFDIPEEYGGGAKAAIPDKKEDKKAADAKKDKGKAAKGAEETNEFEEEDKLMEIEDKRIWTEINLDKGDKSELPSAYIWTITKHDFIDILFKQGRYDEAATAIQTAKVECEEIGDTYFIRLYYQILAMIRIHQGQIDDGIKLYNSIRSYAQKFDHDDIKLAEFYGNFGEFLITSKPDECIEAFKDSRVIFWINLKARGFKVVDVHDYIDVDNGSIKQQKIPEGQKPKKVEAPVEDKKDNKAKPKDPKAAEQAVEVDYSTIEKVIKFDKEMNHELFAIDDSEANLIFKHGNIYLLHLDELIKSNLRFAQACCTVDTKYELSAKVLIDTIKIIERCVYTNPYHKYLAHYLNGYCNKMMFLVKIKEFQKKYGTSTQTKGRSKYYQFIERVPETGLAPGQLFYLLPNYSNNLRNGWKELLVKAKSEFELCLQVAKTEWVFGEFDIDLSDAALNLSEVCYLMAEYRESTKRFVYIDHKKVYLARSNMLNGDQPAEGEEAKDPFDEWEESLVKKDKIDIINLRNQAKLYYKLGVDIFNARHEFKENYHIMSTTNLTDPSKVPGEFVRDIFEIQAIQSAAFLESVSETMEGDLWAALKAKIKTKIDSSEVLCMLKSLSNELLYFTFGSERKSKGIWLIHRYLRLNLASYVQRCVVDYPVFHEATELTPDHEKELKESEGQNWMKFSKKHSRFHFVLQESPHLLAEN